MHFSTRNTLTILLIFIGLKVFAQNEPLPLPLPVLINSNLTLAKGVYTLKTNSIITSGATLTIPEGVKILFYPGAVVSVNGGLNVLGTKDNPVEFTGAIDDKPGVGFKIADQNKLLINLQFSKFKNLEFPLDFVDNWYRKEVNIDHCQFIKILTYGPGLNVRIPENIEYVTPIEFKFNNNSFIDNRSGIFFEDFNHPNLKLQIKNNFIYGNRSFASEREGIVTSPFYFISNSASAIPKADISNNVFADNYMFDPDYDTMITEVNIGVGGISSEVSLPNNYFGGKSDGEKQKRFDHFENNPDVPYVAIFPTLQSMPANMPAFIRKIALNGKMITNPKDFVMSEQDSSMVKVEFSNAIDRSKSTPSISQTIFVESSTQNVNEPLVCSAEWLDDKTVILNVKTTNKKTTKAKWAFYKIFGFIDKQGYEVPSYELAEYGYKRKVAVNYPKAVKNLADAGNEGKGGYDNPIVEDIPNPSDSEPKMVESNSESSEDFIVEDKRKRWETGIFIGESIYFGDLTANDVIDIRDSRLCLGLRFGYNMSPHFGLKAELNKGALFGSDNDIERGTDFTRDFQFNSVLYDFNVQLEYNLNKVGSVDGRRFTPSISGGIGLFYFNPMRTYKDGITYSLYKLHTNGQYAIPENQYSRLQPCMPFGFHLKTIVKKSLLMDLSLTWRLTFTDYLDDVGGGSFASYEDIFNDPTLTQKEKEVAWYFNAPDNNRGGQRGNSTIKDWYVILGLTLARIY